MLRPLHDSLNAANVVGLALLKSRVERPTKASISPGTCYLRYPWRTPATCNNKSTFSSRWPRTATIRSRGWPMIWLTSAVLTVS